MNDKLLSLKEVAKLCKTSTRTLRRWRLAGLFPAPVALPGRKPRWQQDAIKRFIKTGELSALQTDEADVQEAACVDSFASLLDKEKFSLKCVKREIRARLDLPLDAPETAVLKGLYELQTKLSDTALQLRGSRAMLAERHRALQKVYQIVHELLPETMTKEEIQKHMASGKPFTIDMLHRFVALERQKIQEEIKADDASLPKAEDDKTDKESQET